MLQPFPFIVEYTLPFPPSVNTYYRQFHGRAIISKAGRDYRKKVLSIIGQIDWRLEGLLQVTLHLYPPDKRRRDWDNYQKAVWDSLTHAGVYGDDSQIKRAFVEMHEPAKCNGRAVVTLQPLEAE